MKPIYAIRILFLFVLIFPFAVNAQINIDVNKYIENPEMIGENKEPGTAILIPFNS